MDGRTSSLVFIVLLYHIGALMGPIAPPSTEIGGARTVCLSICFNALGTPTILTKRYLFEQEYPTMSIWL